MGPGTILDLRTLHVHMQRGFPLTPSTPPPHTGHPGPHREAAGRVDLHILHIRLQRRAQREYGAVCNHKPWTRGQGCTVDCRQEGGNRIHERLFVYHVGHDGCVDVKAWCVGAGREGTTAGRVMG